MLAQVKTRCFLALLITFGFVRVLAANESTWSQLESGKIEILSHSSAQGEIISSYIPFFQDFGSLFWMWDPKKELKKTTDEVFLEPVSPLTELMRNLFIQFDVSDTGHFRKVWFHLTPDLQVRGLFGIHDFQKKRPFVILRMGLHGNVDELISEKYLAKLLYEELDMNVLLLESLTSHAFLMKNKKISFGGADEGLQTFLILNELTKTALDGVTTSYHLVGLSMGSQGTFLTALLDQANNRKIKSILNFCPLINLRETFEKQNLPGFRSMLGNFWNMRRLNALFTTYEKEDLSREWWKSVFDFKPRFTLGVLALLNRDRRGTLLSPEDINSQMPKMRWPPGLNGHLREAKDLFDLNDFWRFYKNVKTPVMIYTTPDDPLVPNELNSELIFAGQQPGDFSSLKYQRLERGLHCGLAPVYQWGYLKKLVSEGLLLKD